MHRYELSDKEEQIRKDVEHLFDVNPVSRDIDISEYDWEIDWVNLDDIDFETEDHEEQSNVALRERRVAVEKAQLTVGEGNPIIVVGNDNVLIEGFTRYNLLKNHFEESPIPVYRAMPTAEAEMDIESETTSAVSASE
jgi:hypothetical protein